MSEERTRSRKVGKIDVRTMREDARNLLNRLCEEFEQQIGTKIGDVSGYVAFYYLCRYSKIFEARNELMKIQVEDKDGTQRYRPIPIEKFLQTVKVFKDRIEIYVPNLCGGESRITIFKDAKT